MCHSIVILVEMFLPLMPYGISFQLDCGGQALVSPSSSDVDLQDLPEEKEAGGSKRHGATFVQWRVVETEYSAANMYSVNDLLHTDAYTETSLM